MKWESSPHQDVGAIIQQCISRPQTLRSAINVNISLSACVILLTIRRKHILTHDTMLSGWAQACSPLTRINMSEYAEWTFTIITGTRKSQESFSSADKDPVLSPCCCLFCLAFEAACLLIEFIIPAPESLRMASSHSGQGSPTPRLPVLDPPPPHHPLTPSWTNSHSSHPCDGDPGATSTLFTPASCKRWRGMMDYWKAQEHCCPKYSTHRHAFVLFSIHAQCLRRKSNWQVWAFYIRTGMVSGRKADFTAAGENQFCLIVIRQILSFALLLWLQSQVWQFTLGSFQLYHMVFICRFLFSRNISYVNVLQFNKDPTGLLTPAG